jgi:hypothetical protein
MLSDEVVADDRNVNLVKKSIIYSGMLRLNEAIAETI